MTSPLQILADYREWFVKPSQSIYEVCAGAVIVVPEGFKVIETDDLDQPVAQWTNAHDRGGLEFIIAKRYIKVVAE